MLTAYHEGNTRISSPVREPRHTPSLMQPLGPEGDAVRMALQRRITIDSFEEQGLIERCYRGTTKDGHRRPVYVRVLPNGHAAHEKSTVELAKAAARLQHPGVLIPVDAFECAGIGQIFVFDAPSEGCINLREAVQRLRGDPTEADVGRLFTPVVLALYDLEQNELLPAKALLDATTVLLDPSGAIRVVSPFVTLHSVDDDRHCHHKLEKHEKKVAKKESKRATGHRSQKRHADRASMEAVAAQEFAAEKKELFERYLMADLGMLLYELMTREESSYKVSSAMIATAKKMHKSSVRAKGPRGHGESSPFSADLTELLLELLQNGKTEKRDVITLQQLLGRPIMRRFVETYSEAYRAQNPPAVDRAAGIAPRSATTEEPRQSAQPRATPPPPPSRAVEQQPAPAPGASELTGGGAADTASHTKALRGVCFADSSVPPQHAASFAATHTSATAVREGAPLAAKKPASAQSLSAAVSSQAPASTTPKKSAPSQARGEPVLRCALAQLRTEALQKRSGIRFDIPLAEGVHAVPPRIHRRLTSMHRARDARKTGRALRQYPRHAKRPLRGPSEVSLTKRQQLRNRPPIDRARGALPEVLQATLYAAVGAGPASADDQAILSKANRAWWDHGAPSRPGAAVLRRPATISSIPLLPTPPSGAHPSRVWSEADTHAHLKSASLSEASRSIETPALG